MARLNRIAALRILLMVALEDAALAASGWEKGAALGIARTARERLHQMGAVA